MENVRADSGEINDSLREPPERIIISGPEGVLHVMTPKEFEAAFKPIPLRMASMVEHKEMLDVTQKVGSNQVVRLEAVKDPSPSEEAARKSEKQLGKEEKRLSLSKKKMTELENNKMLKKRVFYTETERLKNIEDRAKRHI
ncbi:hypothetical protein N9Y92_03165 [Chlamydiales bacterium]|nr:hypothetical protein [Chlamydiales bacterium]